MNVGELDAGGTFDRDGEIDALLPWSRCRRILNLPRSSLHRLESYFSVLYGLSALTHSTKFVERKHRDRGEVFPIERNAGASWRVDQVDRDDAALRIAAAPFTSKALARGAAALFTQSVALHQAVLVTMPCRTRAI